jgi:hypothetical protein
MPDKSSKKMLTLRRLPDRCTAFAHLNSRNSTSARKGFSVMGRRSRQRKALA